MYKKIYHNVRLIKLFVINSLIFFFSITHAQNSFNPVNTFHQQGLIALNENRVEEAEDLFKYSSNEYSYAPSYFELAKI